MKECIEKMKKEYAAPQMDVLVLDVQGSVLSCSTDDSDCGVDVIAE